LKGTATSMPDTCKGFFENLGSHLAEDVCTTSSSYGAAKTWTKANCEKANRACGNAIKVGTTSMSQGPTPASGCNDGSPVPAHVAAKDALDHCGPTRPSMTSCAMYFKDAATYETCSAQHPKVKWLKGSGNNCEALKTYCGENLDLFYAAGFRYDHVSHQTLLDVTEDVPKPDCKTGYTGVDPAVRLSYVEAARDAVEQCGYVKSKGDQGDHGENGKDGKDGKACC